MFKSFYTLVFFIRINGLLDLVVCFETKKCHELIWWPSLINATCLLQHTRCYSRGWGCCASSCSWRRTGRRTWWCGAQRTFPYVKSMKSFILYDILRACLEKFFFSSISAVLKKNNCLETNSKTTDGWIISISFACYQPRLYWDLNIAKFNKHWLHF